MQTPKHNLIDYLEFKTLSKHRYIKFNYRCQVGFVVDPMIATAGTAIAAINILKDWGFKLLTLGISTSHAGLKKIVFVCILASKEGIDALVQAHPDVVVHVGSIDSELTEQGYIYPGCGDAGDRLFKTL